MNAAAEIEKGVGIGIFARQGLRGSAPAVKLACNLRGEIAQGADAEGDLPSIHHAEALSLVKREEIERRELTGEALCGRNCQLLARRERHGGCGLT